jgi:cytochrome P450
MLADASSVDWSTFDPFDPSVRADPYPHYARLREVAPCLRLERYGVWLVTSYGAVDRVLRDWRTFSSGQGAALEPAANPEEGGVILSTDPPEHTRIRRAVSKDFTPRMVSNLEPGVRSLAERTIDAALGEDQVDWVNALARPLPTVTMAKLMGYPEKHQEQYCLWASTIFNAMGCPAKEMDGPGFSEVAGQLYSFVTELATNHEYVANGWGDRLVQAGDRGELTASEVQSLLGGILVAAMDTTVNMLGNLAYSLTTHPDQWQLLRDSPNLADSAVNESLRFESPVQPGFFRVATEDVQVEGVTIPTGARVMVAFGSANRDRRQFKDADTFLIGRTPNDHLAFGRGTHFCLGAPVARLIGRVVLEELSARVGTLALAGEAVLKNNRMLRGFDVLPLRLAA